MRFLGISRDVDYLFGFWVRFAVAVRVGFP